MVSLPLASYSRTADKNFHSHMWSHKDQNNFILDFISSTIKIMNIIAIIFFSVALYQQSVHSEIIFDNVGNLYSHEELINVVFSIHLDTLNIHCELFHYYLSRLEEHIIRVSHSQAPSSSANQAYNFFSKTQFTSFSIQLHTQEQKHLKLHTS